MTIYERIRELRLSKGMSQSDLAKKVGYVGRSAISKVENGERDISQSMIEKYAEALGSTPAYLLYGNDASINEEKPTADGDELNDKQKEIISKFSKLSDADLSQLLDYADFLIHKHD